jgi:DNA/RNA-binding domain of Phe-tRNA-synthetase-like protein
LRSELLTSIQDEISYDDGSEVEERLAAMKQRVADQVSQAALTNQEKEVIELWRKALNSFTPPPSLTAAQEGQA